MTDPISIPLTRNRYYIPDPGPLAGSTIHPSPSKFRYATITSWYRNETGKHWQSNQLDASSSTMPIPTTPHAVTREIREMVARAFDRLEDGEGEEVVGIDTEKVGDVEGEEVKGVTQKAVCCVITYSGDRGRGKWAVEDGVRVVDCEGVGAQCVRNLCHFLPGVLEELGIE